MIRRVTERTTEEDKSLQPSEIYSEKVCISIYVFGLKVWHSQDSYLCTPKETKGKGMGFRKD